jgi:hypothetical protein
LHETYLWYGKLTRKDIVKTIKENNLLCMFFEGAIRQDEYNKKGVC